MSISLYDASVPVFTRTLGVLSTLLTKAEAHAAETGIAVAELLEARLAPNMFTLTRQIQSACDAAKFGVARPAGVAPPSDPDTETTVAELQVRIKKTQDFIAGVEAKAFEDAETRPVTLKTSGGELPFTGKDYLLAFAIPNFFFHAVTAYDILRHKGLPLEKKDYLALR
jgi:hypothetical protein